jgi:hypothetical protein
VEQIVGHPDIVLLEASVYFRQDAKTRSDNSVTAGSIQSLTFCSSVAIIEQERVKAMKILRNILGTVGLLYAGYVIVASMKDVRRYIRISTM